MRRMLLFASLLGSPLPAAAAEWNGEASYETRYFPHNPLFDEQSKVDASVRLEGSYRQEVSDDLELRLRGFATANFRYNDQRGDVQEASVRWRFEQGDILIGRQIVSWGVAESLHLVDVINPRNFIDNPWGQEKLGQDMVQLTAKGDWGQMQAFCMPWERDSWFPDKQRRFRAPVDIAADHSEHSRSQRAVCNSEALRYTFAGDEWDIALSYFEGQDRWPLLRYDEELEQLRPSYGTLKQWGFEGQWHLDPWVLKMEGISSRRFDHPYSSLLFGLERPLFSDLVDLRAFLETTWEKQAAASDTAVSNSFDFVGINWVSRDGGKSQLKLGLIQFHRETSRVLHLEAHTDLAQRYRIFAKADILGISRKDATLDSFSHDTNMTLGASYFF